MCVWVCVCVCVFVCEREISDGPHQSSTLLIPSTSYSKYLCSSDELLTRISGISQEAPTPSTCVLFWCFTHHQVQPIAFECYFFFLKSQSIIWFPRSLLPRSVEKRPIKKKRDQRDWDWRFTLNDIPNAIGCTYAILVHYSAEWTTHFRCSDDWRRPTILRITITLYMYVCTHQ